MRPPRDCTAMRAAAVLALPLLSLAALAPAAQADPVVDAIVCSVNALLVFPPVVGVLACVDGLAATSPLCLEVYDAATGTLKTFPCAYSCLVPVTRAAAVTGVQGPPGSSVTGALFCGSTATVDATATASIIGADTAIDVGPVPNDGSLASCGRSSALPPLTSYAVVCLPML